MTTKKTKEKKKPPSTLEVTISGSFDVKTLGDIQCITEAVEHAVGSLQQHGEATAELNGTLSIKLQEYVL